jgi:hypothetical protein
MPRASSSFSASSFATGLEGRLDCFGCFDLTDPICQNCCSLSINCAVEKSSYINYQTLNDNFRSILVSGTYDRE